jgi:D-beta-D-heptose 7-phosphate kinase/D-beta-D-heptose 1-phosphate adenosyltransferase
MKIVLVTGGFDPLHSGHISYLAAARQLGDRLVVGVNSDAWLSRKKGRPFMPAVERVAVIENLRMVDHCILFNDDDGSGIEAIRNVQMLYPEDEIIFANGGDRTAVNIPEMVVQDVVFKFGVGGDDKQNSSSWILEEWKKPRTDRAWGYYRVLHEVGANTKLKELTVMPKTCLSMQRHDLRQEFWFVAQGTATVYTLEETSTDRDVKCYLEVHEHTFIECREWHQLCNETDQPLKLIEIQYGQDCVEDDILRK